MRLFNKLTLVAVMIAPAFVGAQEGYPPPDPQYQQQQPVQGPPGDPQYQQAPPEEGQPPVDQAAAQVQQYGFMGPHPVPYDVGSGYCYQQGAHFHDYPPFDNHLFRESGGWFYFVGDPGDFGYSQQMWGYRGHHPIPLAYGGGYCFIDWPHRHNYYPTAGVVYNNVGGYYVYGGPFDPWYWHWRTYYTGYYGGYYRRSYYGGVYWRTRPAPVYRPAFAVGARGVYRAGAVAVVPGGRRVYVGAPGPAHAAVAPAYRAPAPAYHPPATYHSAPPTTAYHPAPVAQQYHPAPAYHPTPATTAYHPASAPQPYRAPAPASHPAPATSFHPAAPAPHSAPPSHHR